MIIPSRWEYLSGGNGLVTRLYLELVKEGDEQRAGQCN